MIVRSRTLCHALQLPLERAHERAYLPVSSGTGGGADGVSVLLSWRLRLGLGRHIVVAGTRMTVQLLLVGLILGWVFALRSPCRSWASGWS